MVQYFDHLQAAFCGALPLAAVYQYPWQNKPHDSQAKCPDTRSVASAQSGNETSYI
jgi:hypothetical protein